MARGIGVRYSERGIRALALERAGGVASVTGLAVGPAEGDVNVFLREHGLADPEAGVAVGLGPGDFLSAYQNREEGMSDRDVEESLRWELGRKMLIPIEEHTVSFAMVGSAGFIFAGRKELVRGFRSPSGKAYIVDVEPIAIYNGCEGAGELDDHPSVLVSAEAEGISTVLLEDRLPVALEGFAAPQDGLLESLPGLDFEGTQVHDEKAVMEFVKYISESLSRLAMRGKGYGRKFPERLILSGGGACLYGIADAAKAKTGIETIVSDPFLSLKVEMAVEAPRLADMGAAFTACLGLALRALEE
ncbi:MAG: type IV pilus biogenesis protein PilM [Candidatus Latescibacterota bacterium]